MVSIIICCFNAEAYLDQAISSVITQEYQHIELIFVNDGSTDNSLLVAESFAKQDKRLKIFSTINQGLNAARNFGAAQTSRQSKALMFVDADDMLEPNAIEMLHEELFSDDGIGAAYCDFKIINEKGEDSKTDLEIVRKEPTRCWVKKIPITAKYTSFYSIYSWTFMQEACTLIKKELFIKYGGWDETEFPKGDTFGESIPLFGSIAIDHKIVFVNRKLYLYRKHGNQITSQSIDYNRIQKKVDALMLAKTVRNRTARMQVVKAIRFIRLRLPIYNYINGSLKHELRFFPVKAIRNICITSAKYLVSLFFRY